MSPKSKSARARRLMALYALRTKVVAEIADLEARIQSEADQVAQLRADFEEFEAAHRTRRRTAECGTDGGYHHHLRQAKDKPCDACRLAHSASERARNARRRAS